MRTIRCHLAAVLFAISGLVAPAWATSFSTDQSDLWYIAAESGWGTQLIQRGSVIFATLFVYGPSGDPTWYTATMDFTSNLTWTGDLYATTGPYFATVPFNPANVVLTLVGTMTWEAQTVETGTLTYVVNGITVVKNVIRESLVLDDFSGRYIGAFHETFSGCFNSADDLTFEGASVLTVAQNGNAISMTSSPKPGSGCTFSGTLSQAGQMGGITGTFACMGGDSGTFTFFELQVNRSGITSRLTLNSTPFGCVDNGWFGGMRGTL
jgi:hypothetical protein